MKKPAAKDILWITDPWQTLDHPKDTTLRIIQECVALGVRTWWCDVKTIRWSGGKALLDACLVKSVGESRSAGTFVLDEPKPCDAAKFSSIHYRPDPPVDLAYLQPLQLLLLGLNETPAKSRVVNPPALLFMANEKLEGGLLPELMPPSIVASQWLELARFGAAEKKTVLKPLHFAQSRGVELLEWETPEQENQARRALQLATEQFQRPVMLQRYLPEIKGGEKRLWFLDGKLLACVKKLPASGEFRINMDAGGTIAKTQLTTAEKKIAARIGKHLGARKIRLAAVDLIAGYVTDFNFTSPGLIPLMEGLLGENLARKIAKALLS